MKPLIINDNLYFEVVKYTMVIVGVWPYKQIRYKWLSQLYRIYSYFPTFGVMICIMGQIIDMPILMKHNQTELLVTDIGLFITYAVEFFKVRIFSSKKIDRLYQAVTDMSLKIRRYQDEGINSIFLKYAKHSKHLNTYYCVFAYFIIFVYSAGIVVQYFVLLPRQIRMNATVSKALPLVTWFPFDENEHYGGALVIHMVLGHLGGLYYMVTQCMLIGLLIYVTSELEVLQYVFKNFQAYIAEYSERHRIPRDIAARHVMKFCIKRHQKIIKYNTELNAAISIILLGEFLLNSLLIASSVFQIANLKLEFTTPFMITYSMMMISHIFILYWHTNEIIVQSTAISDALMESDWKDEDIWVQKCVVIILIRSQKPLTITCGPFSKASTDSIITILKGSYSYAMLMLRT